MPYRPPERTPAVVYHVETWACALRLGGVGSIDAFLEESEKSLATHVGLFSLRLGPPYKDPFLLYGLQKKR